MNELQTIFTFFYALYFAVTMTVSGKLQPFDTASMYKLKPRAWLRFVYSFLLLNILPLAYFYWIFSRLKVTDILVKNFYSLLLLFFLSLAGSGFYRIHYGSMIFNIKGNYIFYDNDVYENDLPKSLKEDLINRPPIHKTPASHLIPGLVWILCSVIFVVLFI